MAFPSRQSCLAVVVVLLVLGVIVCIPVLLIHDLAVHRVSVSVEDASLARFAVVTPTPTMVNSPPMMTATVAVNYNLSMAVRVHNPNRYCVHFAAPLEVRYSLDGALFGPLVLLSVVGNKLHAGDSWVFGLSIGAVGDTLALGADGVADFAWQRSAGVFQVDMVVGGNYTVRGAKRSIAATCALRLPVGAPPASSEKVKCV